MQALLPSDFHSSPITTINYFLAIWEAIFNQHELSPLFSPQQESFSDSKIELDGCLSFILHRAECGEERFPRGARRFGVFLTACLLARGPAGILFTEAAPALFTCTPSSPTLSSAWNGFDVSEFAVWLFLLCFGFLRTISGVNSCISQDALHNSSSISVMWTCNKGDSLCEWADPDTPALRVLRSPLPHVQLISALGFVF